MTGKITNKNTILVKTLVNHKTYKWYFTCIKNMIL